MTGARLDLPSWVDRVPYWAKAFAIVAASLLVAWLLALLDRTYQPGGEAAQAGRSFPVQLGAPVILLEPGKGGVVPPERMMRRTDWAAAQLPLSLGWRTDTLWARMELHNTSASTQAVWFEVSPPRLTHVEIHSLAGSGAWSSQRSGAVMRAADRPLNMAELVFPLTLAPGERRTVLVSAWSPVTALNMSFAVFPAQEYPGIAARNNLLDAVFIGGLLVLGLISLTLGAALRELSLLSLAARIVVTCVWQVQQLGMLALILPSAGIDAMSRNAHLLGGPVLTFTAGFFWAFLAHARLPRAVHYFYAFIVAFSIVVPLGVLAGLIGTTVYPALILYPAWAVLFVTAVLSGWLVFKGFLPAVAMLVGASLAVVVNSPLYLLALGLSGSNVARYFVSPVPSLITSTVLFLGAALMLMRERRELSDALRNEQQRAVTRLEGEVAERTRELVAARDAAEMANRAKSFFLAKVSHELRTPMHTMLGYLELVLREPGPPAVAQKLGSARAAGQQLVGQINDLLDFARMEREQLKLYPAATATRALARRMGERALLLAQERGNRFELLLDTELPPWIMADAGRLQQILMVLLSNAMRYTRGGRVCLRIEPDAHAAFDPLQSGMVALRFEVEDNGRGIAPDALARIFRPFERGASSDGEGMGLGLPIAQQLLALMGSMLDVESRPGEGSRVGFTLAVPLADESQVILEPQAGAFTGYEGRTHQVLVLDDNAANRRYLEELLGDLGFDVRAFATVSGAVAHLEAQCGVPDLCIVDQQLEGSETGWDFVMALRAAQTTPAAIRNCPVMMLSATQALAPTDWPAMRGIDMQLLKPVDQQQLLQAIGELVGLRWVVRASDTVGAQQHSPVARPAATSAAWQALADATGNGALHELEDWINIHRELVEDDARLGRLVQALDFDGIARHARAQLQPAWSAHPG